MLIIIVFAARWIVRKFHLPPSAGYRLVTGLLALALGLSFEGLLVVKLRGLTLPEYLKARDPVAATAYYVSLAVFVIVPLLVRRKTA